MGKYQKQILTATELLELLQKQYADRRDIKLISGKGINGADDDFKKIKELIEKQGHKCPNSLVPMDVVVDYYKINISYLKKITK